MKSLRRSLIFLGWIAFGFLMGVISLFGTVLYRFGWTTGWERVVGIVLSLAPLLGYVWLAANRSRSKVIAAGLVLFLLIIFFAGNILLAILARAGWMQVIP